MRNPYIDYIDWLHSSTVTTANVPNLADAIQDIVSRFNAKPSRSYCELIPLRILKSGIATIVFWQDGTKTVVKRGSDEPESDYAAFTAALGIKIFGSNSALKRIVSRTETQEKKGQKNNGKG